MICLETVQATLTDGYNVPSRINSQAGCDDDTIAGSPSPLKPGKLTFEDASNSGGGNPAPSYAGGEKTDSSNDVGEKPDSSIPESWTIKQVTGI